MQGHLRGFAHRADEQTDADQRHRRPGAILSDLQALTRDLRRLLDALTVAHPEIDTLSARVRDRRQAGRFAQLMPTNPFAAFDREGGIRRYLRYRTWP